MIVKYAGDILADVNKVYVINITDKGVQSLTFPAFCGTSGFVTTFTSPLLDTSCRQCFLNIHFQIHHLSRYVFLSVPFNDTHLLRFSSVGDRFVNLNLHRNDTDVGKQKYSETNCLYAISSTADLCGLACRPLWWVKVLFLAGFKMDMLLWHHEALVLPISYKMLLCTQKNAVSHIFIGINLV